jgi:ribosomal protein L34E
MSKPNLPKDNDKRGIMGDRELPVNYDKISSGERRIVREQYVREQDGKCCHCGQPLDALPAQRITENKIDWTLFPPFFLKNPVHLHHCHKTGMTIGAVHAYCNAHLWQYLGE